MAKKIVCFFFILIFFFCANFSFNQNQLFFSSLGASSQDSLGNGAWMHVDTFVGRTEDEIANFAKALIKAKIDFVFILAKDIDGSTTYPSTCSLKVRFKDDYMGKIVKLLNKEGVKVYLYFVINTDPIWLKAHPEDKVYQAGIKGNKFPIPHPENKLVNLTSRNYMDYIASIISETISKYDIYGIQLDYIRYTNGLYGFSPKEIELAKAKGINIDKIIDLTYQTFVSPGNQKTIFLKYDEGDKDVVEWSNLREEIIFNFADYISKIVHKKGKEFGTTLVSAGASNLKYSEGGSSSLPYAKIHFGQSYEKISSISDFVTPMAYHGVRENVYEWISLICKGVQKKISKNCKVAIGIQANSTTTEKMLEAINAVFDNSYSFVLFRIGTFSLSYYDFAPFDESNTSLYLCVFNIIEGKNIKGITFSNSKGLNPVKDNKYIWIIDDNFFKFYKESGYFTQSLSGFSLELKLNIDYDLINNFFSPFIICSDEKNDFPTLTLKPFSIKNLFINSGKNKLLINGKERSFYKVKTINSSTFIDSSIISELIETNITNQKNSLLIKFEDKEVRLKVGDSNIYYKLGTKDFSFDSGMENLIIENNIYYVPLRKVLEFFGFLIIFNSSTKAINCLKICRDYEVVLFSKFTEVCSDLLFFSDVNVLYVEFSDLLREQYLKLAYEMHIKGVKVFILCNLEKNSPFYFESLFGLLNSRELQILTLDGFSYYSSEEEKFDFNQIKGRDIFLSYNDVLASHSYNARLNLIINSVDNIKFYSDKKYYLKVNAEVVNCLFLPRKKFNLSLLYFSRNFQF